MKKPSAKRLSENKLATKREAYRLWFEYLRVAIKLTNTPTKKLDARMQAKVEKVKGAFLVRPTFYEPWHMDRYKTFNSWWEDHSHLFEEKFHVRLLNDGEAKLDPDAIVVEIPLNRSVTDISKRVAEIVADAQSLRRKRKRKSQVEPTAVYQLSKGSEPKLDILREMLSVYRDVYLQDPTLRGQNLSKKIREYYTSRKNKRFNKVPKSLTDQYEPDAETVKRNIRRYINNAAQVLVNVAAGEFPGRY